MMEIIYTTDALDFIRYAYECVECGHEGCVMHICVSHCVWTGQLPTLDLAACNRHGMAVGRGEYLGGSIVNMVGDLSICITTWGNSDVAECIVSAMAERISSLGNITYDENDVLLDGKKVLSWARATTMNGWCQSVVHCSIGEVDLELIQEVCTKPMVKVPGSLNSYGITDDDLRTIAVECVNAIKGEK